MFCLKQFVLKVSYQNIYNWNFYLYKYFKTKLLKTPPYKKVEIFISKYIEIIKSFERSPEVETTFCLADVLQGDSQNEADIPPISVNSSADCRQLRFGVCWKKKLKKNYNRSNKNNWWLIKTKSLKYYWKEKKWLCTRTTCGVVWGWLNNNKMKLYVL